MHESGPQPESDDPKQLYRGEYAKLYLERTLSSTYSEIKNNILANIADRFGVRRVLDLGSNVHGSVEVEGSLKFQMSKRGIDYIGLDLAFEYFDRQFLMEQGVLKDKIYPKIKGIVGDILLLPVKSDSMEMVTCNDVLEHTNDPSKALSEIYRILKKEGVALVVLPSLYKLDMANFIHIEERRKSSHLEKTTVDEWIQRGKENGFGIDEESSLSIGIASGLSYLAWMDEKFIPERKELSTPETNSTESLILKEARKVFIKYNDEIDIKIRTGRIDDMLLEALTKGNIKEVFQILDQAVPGLVSMEERRVLDSFFSELDIISFKPDRIAEIQKIFRNSRYPKLLLGSSVLLVLKKLDKNI
ncbi:MAG: class I SAM-dependent methyltransferase [Candidatus Vogelbacteria bacterium]|nr:class I SAM-dependent methyltransferase [Candidatus Vogelbacteria bacterium]